MVGYAERRDQIINWKAFKEKFKVRYKASRGNTSIDQLMYLAQKGSVEEYRISFEELAVELPQVSNEVLVSAFLKGLKKSIKDQVICCRPVNLYDMVEIITKCYFDNTEVSYLGHIISGQGVAADPKKSQGNGHLAPTKVCHRITRFLGLTGYNRRFVKNYGQLARPLTELLRKEGFK